MMKTNNLIGCDQHLLEVKIDVARPRHCSLTVSNLIHACPLLYVLVATSRDRLDRCASWALGFSIVIFVAAHYPAAALS